MSKFDHVSDGDLVPPRDPLHPRQWSSFLSADVLLVDPFRPRPKTGVLLRRVQRQRLLDEDFFLGSKVLTLTLDTSLAPEDTGAQGGTCQRPLLVPTRRQRGSGAGAVPSPASPG